MSNFPAKPFAPLPSPCTFTRSSRLAPSLSATITSPATTSSSPWDATAARVVSAASSGCTGTSEQAARETAASARAALAATALSETRDISVFLLGVTHARPAQCRTPTYRRDRLSPLTGRSPVRARDGATKTCNCDERRRQRVEELLEELLDRVTTR